jgi:hypothetical protein
MKLSTCKHCKKEFDISSYPKGWMANHSRWCPSNPKINEYKAIGTCWNKGLTKDTDQRLSLMSQSIKNAHKNNKYKHIDRKDFGGTKKWKPDTRQKISKAARKSKHRRLQRNIIEYKGILFDSTWEVRLAKKLDSEKILWIRPDPIQYIDKKGLTRNYFPDFYLPEYNIFIDPKNPQAYLVQKDKIDCLTKQFDNIIFLKSIEEIDNFCPSIGTAF